MSKRRRIAELEAEVERLNQAVKERNCTITSLRESLDLAREIQDETQGRHHENIRQINGLHEWLGRFAELVKPSIDMLHDAWTKPGCCFPGEQANEGAEAGPVEAVDSGGETLCGISVTGEVFGETNKVEQARSRGGGDESLAVVHAIMRLRDEVEELWKHV